MGMITGMSRLEGSHRGGQDTGAARYADRLGRHIRHAGGDWSDEIQPGAFRSSMGRMLGRVLLRIRGFSEGHGRHIPEAVGRQLAVAALEGDTGEIPALPDPVAEPDPAVPAPDAPPIVRGVASVPRQIAPPEHSHRTDPALFLGTRLPRRTVAPNTLAAWGLPGTEEEALAWLFSDPPRSPDGTL